MTLIVYSNRWPFFWAFFCVIILYFGDALTHHRIIFFLLHSIDKQKIHGITLNRQITSWIFILFPLSLVPVYISLHPQFSLYFFINFYYYHPSFLLKTCLIDIASEPCIGILMAFLYWLCAQFNKIFLMQEFMWSA